MAHLTIRLGAPLIVPISTPRMWSRCRRPRASRTRLRWHAFCEASVTADESRAGRKRWPLPSIRSLGKPRHLSTLGADREIWS